MPQPLPNLLQMYMQAQNARAARERAEVSKLQQDQIREQMKIQAQLPGARQAFFNNDPSKLRQLAPIEAGKIRLQQQEMSKGVFDISKARFSASSAESAARSAEAKAKSDVFAEWENKEVRTAEAMVTAANAINSTQNPAARQGAYVFYRNQFERMGVDEEFLARLPPQVPPPESVEQFGEMGRMKLGLHKQLDIEPMMNLVLSRMPGFNGTNQREMMAKPEFKEAMDDQMTAANKAKQINLDLRTGNIEVAKTVAAKSQQKIINTKELLGDIKELNALNPGRFMGLGGRLKGWALGKADYIVNLPRGSKEFISAQREVRETVAQIFNKYRSEITGAAASIQELDRLQNSIINENLSPTLFAASLNKFTRKLNRTLRIHKKVLRDGLNVSEYDRMWKTGEEARGAEDVGERITELFKDKKSPAEAAQQLEAEGYWTSDQVKNFILGSGQ